MRSVTETDYEQKWEQLGLLAEQANRGSEPRTKKRFVYSSPKVDDTSTQGMLCDCFYYDFRLANNFRNRKDCPICRGSGYRGIRNVDLREGYL